MVGSGLQLSPGVEREVVETSERTRPGGAMQMKPDDYTRGRRPGQSPSQSTDKFLAVYSPELVLCNMCYESLKAIIKDDHSMETSCLIQTRRENPPFGLLCMDHNWENMLMHRY